MINIPYYAWGSELSDDLHERTRITPAFEARALIRTSHRGTMPGG